MDLIMVFAGFRGWFYNYTTFSGNLRNLLKSCWLILFQHKTNRDIRSFFPVHTERAVDLAERHLKQTNL